MRRFKAWLIEWLCGDLVSDHARLAQRVDSLERPVKALLELSQKPRQPQGEANSARMPRPIVTKSFSEFQRATRSEDDVQ